VKERFQIHGDARARMKTPRRYSEYTKITLLPHAVCAVLPGEIGLPVEIHSNLGQGLFGGNTPPIPCTTFCLSYHSAKRPRMTAMLRLAQSIGV